MSIRKFLWFLSEAKVGKRDKEWFPRWLRRYAQTVGSVDGNLSVTVAEVIQFSRSLRDNGTPAWQRLQAVRAVEAYRNLVLKTEQPGLQEMTQKLGRVAISVPAASQLRAIFHSQGPPDRVVGRVVLRRRFALVAGEFHDLSPRFPKGLLQGLFKFHARRRRCWLTREPKHQVLRPRDRMKILHFHGGGLWLYYRILEAGTFEDVNGPDGSRCLMIDGTQLTMLLSGVSLIASRRRRKWYSPHSSERAA